MRDLPEITLEVPMPAVLFKAIVNFYVCSMAIAEVQSWLNSSQEFYTGLALFLKYGKSTSLKTLFTKKGATRYNTEKLEYELSKLAGSDASVPVRKQRPVRVKVHAAPLPPPPSLALPPTLPPAYSDVELPGIEFGKLPDQLKHETIQRVKLYKQAWTLHFKLYEQEIDEQRLDLALEIITKMDEVNRLWERIDYWLKHGEIPPGNIGIKPDTAGDDPVSLVHRQMNLRTYVSRANRKLKILVNPVKRNKLQDDIDKWKLEIQDIDKKINS